MTKDKSILINNIYHMLSYAFQTLNQETYDDVAVESFDEMYNLLAAILAKGIGLQLKQGLYREYISRQEELPVMRGKINMPGTIKNKLAHERVLTCDFDELSENNTLNQILKTTVMLLLRNGKVQAKYKDDLKKKMLYFSNVDIIEPTGIKWSSIRFQRNNQTYRMLVSICQLIIEGMLITTDAGDYRLASFVDEQRMCRLYEKFILEYYSRHYPALSVSASQIPWALDDGVGTMLPVMQSDIHLQRGNTVLIIDAKYYSHTTQVQFDMLPDLLPAEEEKKANIGVWAMRHKRYLKQNHKVRYYNLLTSGKVNSYLTDIEQQAQQLFLRLVNDLAEQEGVTEQLKATDMMLWIQKMNNIRNRATEIVNAELIYTI